jgi:hypothetical protein
MGWLRERRDRVWQAIAWNRQTGELLSRFASFLTRFVYLLSHFKINFGLYRKHNIKTRPYDNLVISTNSILKVNLRQS